MTMMISPDYYLSEYENASYAELLKLKNKLVDDIASFENTLGKNNFESTFQPGSDVRYQWNLEVLGKLLILLQKAFNREYEL
ncbi:MAG: hypothetical protein MJ174_10645 [Treponema sp.]|nr:hypothetical protein [Treponema sp.]